MLDGRRDQITATFRGGNIAVIRDCLASTRSNAIGHLFRDRGILPEPRYLGPQVVHNDPGAAFGEKFDVCPPKPATCASYNRDFSLQRNSFCHRAILLPARLNVSSRNRDTNCGGAMGPLQSQTHAPAIDNASAFEKFADVCLWPICDLAECPLFSRCWGLTGHQSASR